MVGLGLTTRSSLTPIFAHWFHADLRVMTSDYLSDFNQICGAVFTMTFSRLTYFLHQSIRAGWAFGSTYRGERFGLFPSAVGFTRWRGREVQFSLQFCLGVALKTQV